MTLNPRVLRGSLAPWVGKKVTIGTAGNHYLSGTVYAVDGRTLKVSVRGRIIAVAAQAVTSIQEAPALQAEFVK